MEPPEQLQQKTVPLAEAVATTPGAHDKGARLTTGENVCNKQLRGKTAELY